MELLHSEEKARFYFDLDHGECHVDYRKTSNDAYDLQHTWTSVSQRGNGLAKDLVTQICEWMSEHDEKLIPSCSYIDAFINKHSQYQSLVAADY